MRTVEAIGTYGMISTQLPAERVERLPRARHVGGHGDDGALGQAAASRTGGRRRAGTAPSPANLDQRRPRLGLVGRLERRRAARGRPPAARPGRRCRPGSSASSSDTRLSRMLSSPGDPDVDTGTQRADQCGGGPLAAAAAAASGSPGHRREDDVVEGAAQRVRTVADVVDEPREKANRRWPDSGPTSDDGRAGHQRGGQRAGAADRRPHLPGERRGASGRGRRGPAPGPSGQPGQRASGRGQRQLQRRRLRLRVPVVGRPAARGSGAGVEHDVVEVGAGDPVDHAVVDLGDQRPPAAGQPLDRPSTPTADGSGPAGRT